MRAICSIPGLICMTFYYRMANLQHSGGQANHSYDSQGGQAMTSNYKTNKTTDGGQAIVKKKKR